MEVGVEVDGLVEAGLEMDVGEGVGLAVEVCATAGVGTEVEEERGREASADSGRAVVGEGGGSAFFSSATGAVVWTEGDGVGLRVMEGEGGDGFFLTGE
jgi:hypothetical protein